MTEALEDLNRIERQALGELRHQTRDILETLEKERKEMERDRELLRDLIRDLAQLSDQASTQIKAMAIITDKLRDRS